MGKNIILNQLNEDNTYDGLYPAGTIDYTFLSKETSEAYGVENGTVKDALNGLHDYISQSNIVSLKVIDSRGTPLQGIRVMGISGTPSTDADGLVSGVANTNSLTLVSSYVDIEKTKTVDISKYINTLKILTVMMNNVAENYIVRYNTSQQVKFSSRVKSVDVCCVGGGGGGCKNYSSYNGTASLSYYPGGGGGGGAIVNEFNLVPQPEILYNLNVGTGGSSGYPATDGGTSNFMDVYAPGGKGAANVQGGAGGNTESGNGGTGGQDAHVGNGGRATVSEFTDGKVYYSGGGGGGHRYLNETSGIVPFTGGSPNGANGGAASKGSHRVDATKAGIGGGGGGGTTDNYGFSYNEAQPSSGGNGIVAIRIHFS